MLNRLPFIIFLFFAFTACKKGKNVATANPDFIGIWHSENTLKNVSLEYRTLEIDENGYIRYTDSAPDMIDGKGRLDGDVLRWRNQRRTVTEKPLRLTTLATEWWRMKLDNEYYYRGPEASVTSCEEPEIFVENASQDTVTGTFNGNPVMILPGLYQNFPVCFGCDATYTDTKGNSFSVVSVDCLGREVFVIND